MTIGCIDFSNNFNNYNLIKKYFLTYNLYVDYICYSKISENINFDNIYDLTIIIGNGNPEDNIILKNRLSKVLSTSLYMEGLITTAIRQFYNSLNIPVPLNFSNESYILSDSSPIIVENSEYHGFNYNNIFFLSSFEILKSVLDNNILQYLNNINYKKTDSIVLKIFGIDIFNVKSVLKSLNTNKFTFNLYEKDGDIYLYLFFNDAKEKNIIIEKIYEKFGKYIYNDEDKTLAELIVELATLYKKKISIVETITCGNCTKEILEIKGASGLLNDCLVLCDNTTIININDDVEAKYGKVSIQNAYEICAEVLERTKSDIVSVTLGNDDLCFIAVGDADGIHVYKNIINKNNYNNINILTNINFFHIIKKLKQNDLFFDKTTI